LARAYLEYNDRDSAKELIDRIEELDSNAFVKSTECAALKGRYYSEAKNYSKAAEIYDEASAQNPDSYYLANLAAESYAATGELDQAKRKFQVVLTIIKRLGEDNVWTMASQANAYIALGDIDAAEEVLNEFTKKDRQISNDERSIIQDGFNRIAGYFSEEKSVIELNSLIGNA